jgi:hypothetical protein
VNLQGGAEIQNKGALPETGESLDEDLAMRDDVRALAELIDDIWQHGASRNSIKIFYELLPPIAPDEAWEAAAEDHLQQHASEKFIERISQARDLADKNRNEGDSIITRVQELLNSGRK